MTFKRGDIVEYYRISNANDKGSSNIGSIGICTGEYEFPGDPKINWVIKTAPTLTAAQMGWAVGTNLRIIGHTDV